jgi:diguanylate cyclase (GGDEF)-like protein
LNDQLVAEIEERKRAEAALEKAATTDYLTRLHNRRSMILILNREMKRIDRSGKDSSVIMIDLDEFKKINDRFGHAVGDMVLIHMGKLLKSLLREQDAISRWGGEELLILLPETDRSGGEAVAEKLRKAVAGAKVNLSGQRIQVTISLGVSLLTQGISIDECIRQADEALYQAKSDGRNKTVVAD